MREPERHTSSRVQVLPSASLCAPGSLFLTLTKRPLPPADQSELIPSQRCQVLLLDQLELV